MKHINAKRGLGTSLLTLAVAAALTGCGGKEASEKFYSETKDALGLTDVLREGEISYSFFGGEMTVEDPEFRVIVPSSRRYANTGNYARDGRNINQDLGETLVAWFPSQISDGTLALKADKLTVERTGDDESGSVSLSVKGIKLDTPYLATFANESVTPHEIHDKVVPTKVLQSTASGYSSVGHPHTWHANFLNFMPGTGNWVVNATGTYGATLDLDMFIERESDGEGAINVTLTHSLDGSEMGSIERKARFESLPKMEELTTDLAKSVSGIKAGIGGQSVGAVVVAMSLESLAREMNASEFEVTYDGYKVLAEAFEKEGLEEDDKGFNTFCYDRKISNKPIMGGVRDRADDSECSIAKSLIQNGSYRERYSFDPSKTLYAELAVNKKYIIEID